MIGPPGFYIKHTAVARVKDALPIPTECPYCGGPVRLAHNAEIYGEAHGRWPYSYWCELCDAHVGVHPETNIPLGTLADAATRRARMYAKASFVSLTQVRGWSRTRMYDWLAQEMGLPRWKCHFGWFDKKRCLRARKICASALAVEIEFS